MNVNLITYAFTSFIYLSMFIISFWEIKAIQVDASDDEKRANCRIIMASDFIYFGVWGALISRASMTSYMNLKFSRNLE